MDDKISMLAQYLPAFLVTNRGLYAILSAGVHALSEADCLRAFPVVKLAIELILDEELERKQREAKVASATKDIASLRSGQDFKV